MECAEVLSSNIVGGGIVYGEFGTFKIWSGTDDELVRYMIRSIKEERKLIVHYINAYIYNLAHKDKHFAQILKSADILYPDGMSVVLLGRILYGQKFYRMTALDFFPKFLSAIEREGMRLFFLGTDDSTINKAVEKIKTEYSELNVVGVYQGYFSLQDSADIVEMVNRSQADALIVGMGSPRQEIFANENVEFINAKLVWTVGALFDYYGGKESIAPRWMGKIGLEWVYRLLQNPKDKWRRYLVGNWEFLFNVLVEWKRKVGGDYGDAK